VRFGLGAFIVPFLFIQNQGILLDGPVPVIIRTTITAAAGVWMLSTASEGWFRGRLSAVPRIGLAAAALLLIAGDPWTDVAGLVLGGAILGLLTVFSRRASA
jgi:TRAP-type uncharacterized transport system fused permease subunit